MKHLIDCVRDAHHVKRWSGTNIIGHRRSISEHSFEVALISNKLLDGFFSYLTEKNLDESAAVRFIRLLRGETLEYALSHDLAEVFTNDVSYVAKAKSQPLKDALEELEVEFLRKLELPTSEDVSLVSRIIVKTADIIVVAIEIQEQLDINNGSKFKDNKNVDKIIKSVMDNFYKLGKELDLDFTDDTINYCIKVLETRPWENL